MAKFLLPILLGLASLQAAVAAPTPETLPELVTGPGLPTLAELNLTLADLRTMSPPSPRKLTPRPVSPPEYYSLSTRIGD